MFGWFDGKKSYIVSTLMGVASFYGYMPSEEGMDLLQMTADYLASPQLELLLEGLGIAGLRRGMK